MNTIVMPPTNLLVDPKVQMQLARIEAVASPTDWACIHYPEGSDTRVDFYATQDAAELGDDTAATHKTTIDANGVVTVLP
jgi:hypothetical protein